MSIIRMLNKKIVKGFSLLEIMVAISLLAVSLVAIISVGTKILQVEHVTENDFIAKGLLVEGLEIAKAVRNSNINSLLPFYTSLTVASPTEGTVYNMRIDYTGTANSVSSLTDPSAQLLYNSATFYQYVSGTPAIFYRMLKTTYHMGTNIVAKDWLDVESQVYWSDRGRGSTQKISITLYNTSYLH